MRKRAAEKPTFRRPYSFFQAPGTPVPFFLSPREAGDGIEENHDIAFVLDETLSFFQHHFGDLNVTLRRLIESRADDLALHRAGHVSDFFRALVDEQNDQSDFGMIDGDGIGDGLQHHGLASARRSDDQASLAFADGAEKIEDATSHVFLGRFHFEATLRVQGSEIVEENLVPRDFRILEVDGFDFDQREVAFAVFGRADLSGNGVTGAEIELANLRR